jgi:hypothetical protein
VPNGQREEEGEKSPIPTVSWTPLARGHKYLLGVPGIQTTRKILIQPRKKTKRISLVSLLHISDT